MLLPDVSSSHKRQRKKQGPKSPMAKRRRMHNYLPNGPPGPSTIHEFFSWAQQYWAKLSTHGLGHALANALGRGLNIHTDYSGMGGPEDAVRQIVEAAPNSDDLRDGRVRFERAGDCDEICRQVLLNHEGWSSPGCVFGSITDRCPMQLLEHWTSLQKTAVMKVEEAKTQGLDWRQMAKDEGHKFFKKASACMFSFQQPARATAHYCYRHETECPFPRVPRKTTALTGLIAGVICWDWSTMGICKGWLGKSAIIYLACVREAILFKYSFVLFECTQTFDDVEGLSPFLDHYEAVTLKFSPTMLGLPISRVRKYMVLIRKDTLKWRAGIAEAGHLTMFKKIFGRSIKLHGVDLLRAPTTSINLARDALAVKRAMPPRRSGKPWSFSRCKAPVFASQFP